MQYGNKNIIQIQIRSRSNSGWSIIIQIISLEFCFCFCISPIKRKIWAAAWQNQQNDLCAQPRLGSAWASALSLIRVFAVRMKEVWVLFYPSSAQPRLWSDWADAQSDLSLRWMHNLFCCFFRAAAHLILNHFQSNAFITCLQLTDMHICVMFWLKKE